MFFVTNFLGFVRNDAWAKSLNKTELVFDKSLDKNPTGRVEVKMYVLPVDVVIIDVEELLSTLVA